MKIGIMGGAHHHAEAYLRNLRKMEEVEVAGVADANVGRGSRVAEDHEAPFFQSYTALLDAGVDGVIVTSENSRHRPLVELAADAGIPVLCEKPLATTVGDAEAMVEACADAGVMLMIAFPMRFSTPLLVVKQQLATGELGEVVAIQGVNQGKLPTNHAPWFVDPELAGGGALIDHAVHLVDVMRWYLNSEVREVYAQTNRILHAENVGVETGALTMLTFENGVFATIDASWSRPPSWPSQSGLGFELVTERGAVMVDAFSQKLVVYSHEQQRPTWHNWGSDANRAMIGEFVDAIREERQPRVSGLDGLRAVEVTMAAYESAATGRPVLVEF